MTRVDWIVLKRLTGRILVTLAIIFSLILLLESLDYGRFQYLTQVGGLPLAITSLMASASRLTVRTLSVTVLIGTIIGILDLQARHELNVIKASGQSIWHVVRAPLVAVFLASLVVALFVESATTEFNRSVNPTQNLDTGAVTSDGALWLDQTGNGESYIIRAGRVQPGGTILNDVTVFLTGDWDYDRIHTPEIRYAGGMWKVVEGTGFQVGSAPRPIENIDLPTASGPADLKVRMASTQDLTFFELASALSGDLKDPILRNAVTTRFMRLLTLPLLLTGSVLIAFAFTAGYRRTNKYGAAVLYGIVLGFVVFFVTEMADRAGSAGALDPTFAAVGPALVAVVVGLTVLLYREDGRA